MRKITAAQSLTFAGLLLIVLVLAIGTTWALLGWIPLGDFRGLTLLIVTVILIYAYALLSYRTFLHFVPLKEGPITKGSQEEFSYHVYLLFYLVLFQPLTRSFVVPVPIMRAIYLALGARLGFNTYSAGVILDPPLTEVGANTIIGHDSLLYAHVVEGNDLSLAPVRIGNNVTIGAKAVIMPGVTIDDGAIVAVGAVVRKATHIGTDEVWGGMPARFLHRIDEQSPPKEPAT